jgi:DNA-directed RNA polymerase beta subunit
MRNPFLNRFDHGELSQQTIPSFVPPPQPPLPELRSFSDVKATRDAVFSRVRNAASSLRPVENAKYSLGLEDIDYSDDKDPTPDEEKATLMRQGSLTRTLKGTWVLTDKSTGQTTRKKAVLAKVPYLLDNSTFLRNGTKYTMRNQFRLLPGVYTRIKENGEYESHVNADTNEGAIHHYSLDSDTGVLNVLVSSSKTPIYGLAKAMGATDEEMKDAWGESLWRINKAKFSTSHIAKFYRNLSRGKQTAQNDQEKLDAVRSSLEKISLSPDVMETTLGKPYTKLTKDVLLDATKKLILLSRGEAESDDRDNFSFQEIYAPEDIFEERIAKDAGSVRRKLLHQLTWRYRGNVDKIPSGALTGQIDGAIQGSGLSLVPEEINPLEIFNTAYATTKLGTGGIASSDAVADETRNILPSALGVVDPSRTPESDRVGVDTYLAAAVKKGSDRQLYVPVQDKNGQDHWLRPREMHKKTIAVASEYHNADEKDWIPAMSRGKEMLVKKQDVDFLIPHFENVFSPLANLIPWKSAVQGNRVAMGSRMLTQAVPLVHGEQPFLQSAVPGRNDQSFYRDYGKYVGAVFADQPGRVLEATEKHFLVENADGTQKKILLQRHHPSNRKTFLSQFPTVAVGQRVQAGDVLAKSNFTDDSGAIAMGVNAKVITIPWKHNFEDGIAISESFAKKMTSQHMYQSGLDWSPEYGRGRHSFMGRFPTVFNKEQLSKIDENGVIRVGETVDYDDPLVVVTREKDNGGLRVKKGRKRSFEDVSLKWDHHDSGVVTDVFYDDKGVRVLVKAESKMKDGDKLSNRYGAKSVVKILSDDEMPMTEDGMVADVAFSPTGTVSRGNPVQIAELALGKISLHTGKIYRVSDFEGKEGVMDFVEKELQKHGINPFSAVIDRKTGERITNADGSGIANGSMWLMKLHHSSEGKGSARGLGGYSSEETPTRGGKEGSKRMAMMHLNALISHGAPYNVMDAKYYRGQANEDYWMQYMQGMTPSMKKTPLVYQKFENSLKASGINVKPSDNRLNIMAMTTNDVLDLAGDREVRSGETIRWEKDKSPVVGGLFDPSVFGMNGDRWGKITPAVPLLNPVMEEPARVLLKLTQKQFQEVASGESVLPGYGTGFSAIQKALESIKVPLAVNEYRDKVKYGKKSERDQAVRALGYLKACEATGIHPKDWMLSAIPVLPPKFRPVSEMKDSKTPLVDDVNYLYKLLIDSNNGVKELKQLVNNASKEEYGVYNAYKQVTGLTDPTHPKLVQRKVRGLLRHVFGVGTSKFSMVQRSLLGTPVDNVGSGVIIPNPDLGLDEIGIPEESAYDVYRPHLMHRLTRRGISWANAAEMIESRNTMAQDALAEEMKARPVIATRAPVLHKYGIFAFRPKLMKGDAVHLNVFTEKGFGADFDGDQMVYHVPASEKAVKEAYEMLLPSRSLLQASDMKSAQPRLISEYSGGLYLASLPPDEKKQTRYFSTWADAEKAYQQGKISIDTPIEVLKKS